MLAIDTICRTPPGKAEVSLRGKSGVLHGFTAFPLAAAPCGPAVYIHARPFADLHCHAASGWTLLSVGEHGDLRNRPYLRNGRLVEGMALGATHLLVHFCTRDAGQRRLIVDDLSGPLKLEAAPSRAA